MASFKMRCHNAKLMCGESDKVSRGGSGNASIDTRREEKCRVYTYNAESLLV
jgi:hypothetical protein